MQLVSPGLRCLRCWASAQLPPHRAAFSRAPRLRRLGTGGAKLPVPVPRCDRGCTAQRLPARSVWCCAPHRATAKGLAQGWPLGWGPGWEPGCSSARWCAGAGARPHRRQMRLREGDALGVGTGWRESHVWLLNAIQTPSLAASSDGWLWWVALARLWSARPCLAGAGSWIRRLCQCRAGQRPLCKHKYLLSAIHLAAFLSLFCFQEGVFLCESCSAACLGPPRAVHGLRHILGVKVVTAGECARQSGSGSPRSGEVPGVGWLPGEGPHSFATLLCYFFFPVAFFFPRDRPILLLVPFFVRQGKEDCGA